MTAIEELRDAMQRANRAGGVERLIRKCAAVVRARAKKLAETRDTFSSDTNAWCSYHFAMSRLMDTADELLSVLRDAKGDDDGPDTREEG